MLHWSRSTRAVGLSAVCLAVGLSACSSSSKTAKTATAPTTATPAAGAPAATGSSAPAAGGPSAGTTPAGGGAAALQAAYAGAPGTLPTTTVTPPAHASLWVVSCGQSQVTCSSTVAAAVTAAGHLGWQTHVCDGQLNPAAVSSCVRQAVAAKASAVDVIGFDCPPIKQAVLEANKAGVKTVNGGGFECAELGDTKVFDGFVRYLAAYPNHQWWQEIGKLQADWLIGATGGKAKVLSLKFTDEAWGADIQTAFAKELSTCSGCSVVKTVEIGNADVATGSLRTKFSTALLQAPSANAVNVPIDGWFPAGLAQAVSSSGRSSKLKVIGAFGQAPNLGYIRGSAGENASAAFSSAQSGWAGVDVAARLLAGQSMPAAGFPEGLGLQVLDASHGLPAAGQDYQPPLDYQAGYLKLWGKA